MSEDVGCDEVWGSRQLRSWAVEMETQVAQARIEARRAADSVAALTRSRLVALDDEEGPLKPVSATPAESLTSLHQTVTLVVGELLSHALTDFGETVHKTLQRLEEAVVLNAQRHERAQAMLERRMHKLRNSMSLAQNSIDTVSRSVNSMEQSMTQQRRYTATRILTDLVSRGQKGVLQEIFGRWLRFGRRKSQAKRAFKVMWWNTRLRILSGAFRWWLQHASSRKQQRQLLRTQRQIAALQHLEVTRWRWQQFLRPLWNRWHSIAVARLNSQRLRRTVSTLVNKNTAHLAKRRFRAWCNWLQLRKERSQSKVIEMQRRRCVVSALQYRSESQIRRKAFAGWFAFLVHERQRSCSLQARRRAEALMLRCTRERQCCTYFHRWLSATKARCAARVESETRRNALKRLLSVLARRVDFGRARSVWSSWVQLAIARRSKRRISERVCHMMSRNAVDYGRKTLARWMTAHERRRSGNSQTKMLTLLERMRTDVGRACERSTRTSRLVYIQYHAHQRRLQQMGTHLSRWQAWAHRRRLLRQSVCKLQTTTKSKLLLQRFDCWKRLTSSRAAPRTARDAVATALGILAIRSGCATLRLRTFRQWTRWVALFRMARGFAVATTLRGGIRHWRQRLIKRQARMRATAQLHADRMAVALAGERAARMALTSRVFERWLRFIRKCVKAAEQITGFAARHRDRRRRVLFGKWANAAADARRFAVERQRAPVVNLTAFVERLERAVGETADSVAYLCRERERLSGEISEIRQRHGSESSELTNRLVALMNKLSGDPNNAERTARLQRAATDAGLPPRRGIRNQPDPGLAALGSTRRLHELVLDAQRDDEWKPTVPVGPHLSKHSSSRYCEWCFDKDHQDRVDPTGAGSRSGASRGATCRLRFYACVQSIDALANWMLFLDDAVHGSSLHDAS